MLPHIRYSLGPGLVGPRPGRPPTLVYCRLLRSSGPRGDISARGARFPPASAAGSARPSSRCLPSPCPSLGALQSLRAPDSLFFSLFIYLRAAHPHPHCPNFCLAISPVCLFSPYSFLSFFPCVLSLHFCCFFSLCYQSSNFIFLTLSLFLPTPLPLPRIPCISCSPGNFTDRSPDSSLIISNASRLPPHPLHSNQLRSRPWKMSRWSSGVTGTHLLQPSLVWLLVCGLFFVCFVFLL